MFLFFLVFFLAELIVLFYAEDKLK